MLGYSIHLVLFFTRELSLQKWAENGSLQREIALYVQLQQKGVRVDFLTYGGRQDLKYSEEVKGIGILCNRWNLPRQWYEALVPLLHADALRRSDILKSNQTKGCEIALRAAQIWRKPLISRCGYIWSEFARAHGHQQQASEARRIESKVYRQANKVVVATPSMVEYIVAEYDVPASKIQVIPNYVMTDVFVPATDQQVPNRVCYVGRLSEQKNLTALIQACAGLDVELWLVGEGHLRKALQELAAELGVIIRMPGNLPHHQLPNLINGSAIFTLVSHFEGHPKALLEAMSCGAAVIGADSPGIREQIRHGETGWLCGTNPESIRAAIQHLLNAPALRTQLGIGARRYIQANYSLERIVELEHSVLQAHTNGARK